MVIQVEMRSVCVGELLCNEHDMIGQILHNNCCRYCFCCVLLPSLLLFLLGIFVVSTTILVAVISVSIATASAPSWRLSLHR